MYSYFKRKYYILIASLTMMSSWYFYPITFKTEGDVCQLITN